MNDSIKGTTAFGIHCEEDRRVPHRSDEQGIVISRVQIMRHVESGKRFQTNYWSDWATGRIDHLETIELN